MKISTKGRYALRVMIDLAINSKGDYVRLRDIAKRQDISIKYLEQIMALLNKADFVSSARGNIGGYKLTKSPKEYKIGDILKATEGNLNLLECLIDDKACNKKDHCKTYSFWNGLNESIIKYVNSKTLKDLIE